MFRLKILIRYLLRDFDYIQYDNDISYILFCPLTNIHINLWLPYCLIYLTLHWSFLINLRQWSLSLHSYVYSCHTGRAGLFNVLFTGLMWGKVAQWLRFWTVYHDTMGSNPAETVYNFYFCWHVYSTNVEYFFSNVLL